MIQMRSIFNVNKRGEEQASGTGYLLAGAIAVAVLAIVGYFVYSFYTGKAIPSFGFLPSSFTIFSNKPGSNSTYATFSSRAASS